MLEHVAINYSDIKRRQLLFDSCQQFETDKQVQVITVAARQVADSDPQR